jgi:hypothetical protein
LNTQDEDIRKRKLDAFIDDILDKNATVIADDLLDNYKAHVGLASTDLINDAKIIDKSTNPAGRPKAADKEETKQEDNKKKGDKKAKATKADTGAQAAPVDDTQLKAQLKNGDPEAWKDTSTKKIKDAFSRPELFNLAVNNKILQNTATEKQKNTKSDIIQLLKTHYELNNLDTKQTEDDDDEEDDEVEDSDEGEDTTGAGFTPHHRSLLRLLK